MINVYVTYHILRLMPFTLTEPFQTVEEIKKSRFLVNVAPVDDMEQATQFINRMSDLTATHNCWAWKIGSNYRFNDDGEPSGTAGRPILTAIEGQQCDYLVAVVTRWFGGIKLGTGGLVRAYGGSVARTLQQANLIELIERTRCQFHCYYNEWPLLENRLKSLNSIIEQQIFDALSIQLYVALPSHHVPTLQQWLNDLTKGRVQASIMEE